MEKLTMKEKVLRFVESKGSATFTEIQEFIVDTNKGPGAYREHQLETVWDSKTGKTRPAMRRKYRGYYSGAFYKAHGMFPWSNPKDGYFLTGQNRLVKGENGKYTVVRNS
jgi:hypothetical protein